MPLLLSLGVCLDNDDYDELVGFFVFPFFPPTSYSFGVVCFADFFLIDEIKLPLYLTKPPCPLTPLVCASEALWLVWLLEEPYCFRSLQQCLQLSTCWLIRALCRNYLLIIGACWVQKIAIQ
uniref:Uncharacterized protein n=1 Tax=Ixodes ricinus TaxID=34613 RepID=A0A147BIM9_IXORI